MLCIGKFAPIFAVAVCYRELIVTAAGKELMFSVAIGGLSAVSLGVADFIASQSSERIGATRALAGMLFVSSLLLTVLMIATDRFSGLFVSENVDSIVLACFHGTAMALALLLFFYALSIGKISVVAPIIAAHPVVIVLFLAVQGAYLPVTQLIFVVTVLLGVAFVAASDSARYENGHKTKQYEKWHKVILVSAASSVIYGVAIILLQNAANGIEDLQILWFGRCVGFATYVRFFFSKKDPISSILEMVPALYFAWCFGFRRPFVHSIGNKRQRKRCNYRRYSVDLSNCHSGACMVDPERKAWLVTDFWCRSGLRRCFRYAHTLDKKSPWALLGLLGEAECHGSLWSFA